MLVRLVGLDRASERRRTWRWVGSRCHHTYVRRARGRGRVGAGTTTAHAGAAGVRSLRVAAAIDPAGVRARRGCRLAPTEQVSACTVRAWTPPRLRHVRTGRTGRGHGHPRRGGDARARTHARTYVTYTSIRRGVHDEATSYVVRAGWSLSDIFFLSSSAAGSLLSGARRRCAGHEHDRPMNFLHDCSLIIE